MPIEIVVAITSFIISLLIVPVLVKYSLRKNLVDIPGRRKIHKKLTPSMGGIAIFCGFCVSVLIWLNVFSGISTKFILLPLFVIFLVGIRDDLISLKLSIKLGGQLVSAIIFIFLFDLRLKSFYGFGGASELPIILSFIITVFTIIIITNSFNLIDGLDGLAGSIALVSLFVFGLWFFLTKDSTFSVLSFALWGAVLGFLIFNWEPSKIFMGDTGALVIGMMLAILAIHFIDSNYNLSAENYFKFDASVSTAMCFISVPLIDTVRIIIIRFKKRQSPFTPDKSHIHHTIMRLGMSHRQTTLILVGVQILFIIISILFRHSAEVYLLISILLLAFTLSVTLDWLILKKLANKSGEE